MGLSALFPLARAIARALGREISGGSDFKSRSFGFTIVRGPWRSADRVAPHRPSQPRRRFSRSRSPCDRDPFDAVTRCHHVAVPDSLADLFRHRDNKNTVLQGELRACFLGFTVNTFTLQRFVVLLDSMFKSYSRWRRAVRRMLTFIVPRLIVFSIANIFFLFHIQIVF